MRYPPSCALSLAAAASQLWGYLYIIPSPDAIPRFVFSCLLFLQYDLSDVPSFGTKLLPGALLRNTPFSLRMMMWSARGRCCAMVSCQYALVYRMEASGITYSHG